MIHLEVSWSHNDRKVQTSPKSFSSCSSLSGLITHVGECLLSTVAGFPHSHCSQLQLSMTLCHLHSCPQTPTCSSITCPCLWLQEPSKFLFFLGGGGLGRTLGPLNSCQRGQCSGNPAEGTWSHCSSSPIQWATLGTVPELASCACLTTSFSSGLLQEGSRSNREAIQGCHKTCPFLPISCHSQLS